MIKYVEGNLITMATAGEFDIIAHGCNCFCEMGAGIALQIAEVFPAAKDADRFATLEGVDKLGGYTIAKVRTAVNTPLVILNLYTQYNPGPDFQLAALEIALTKIKKHVRGYRIGFPMIGAGIGGGNWEEINKLIVSILRECDVTIVKYKK